MSFNILFLDIDGTILKPDHTYSALTKDAINQVKQQGIEVFFATGRPTHELSELAAELGIDNIIGYNGANVICGKKTIINEVMQKQTIHEFLEIAQKNNNEIVFYTNHSNYFTFLNTEEAKQFINTFQSKKNRIYTPEAADKVLGCTIMNATAEHARLYEIEPDLHLSKVNVEEAGHCFDVIRKTVNKGQAIKQVLKRLNLPKESAVAFGDGMNDKEMMLEVGHGFAMGNANPELIPFAAYQTTSVEQDGIYNGLKRLGIVT